MYTYFIVINYKMYQTELSIIVQFEFVRQQQPMSVDFLTQAQ